MAQARAGCVGGLMGLFWFGGQSLYAIGITWMGELGVVIGWPLLMGMIISHQQRRRSSHRRMEEHPQRSYASARPRNADHYWRRWECLP